MRREGGIRSLLLPSMACALGFSLACCLTAVGPGGGPGAGDGGRDAGPRDAGATLDTGPCRIGDGGLVAAGAWLSTDIGSCIVCDPGLNPNGWTALDAGQACEWFNYVHEGGPFDVPLSGVCATFAAPPFLGCISSSGTCDGQHAPCAGGFCGDAGYCELDQNLGWPTECWAGPEHPNLCAQGPCCMDAGFEGIPNGGGWCCGLIDGGVQPACLASGLVCYATSDCCEGLTCTGHNAVFDSDAGYGFCE